MVNNGDSDLKRSEFYERLFSAICTLFERGPLLVKIRNMFQGKLLSECQFTIAKGGKYAYLKDIFVDIAYLIA